MLGKIYKEKDIYRGTMEQNEHNTRMIEKFDFFYSEKVPVHINKLNGEWMNGYLMERKSDSVFMLDEREKGLVAVFISDVKDIEMLKPRGFE